MTADETAPIELKLTTDRRVLAITWEDGTVSRLDAPLLRRHSRSAAAVRAALEGVAAPADGVTLARVEPVGAYAVRLSFSDGHDRGIYPWRHLRAIADGTA